MTSQRLLILSDVFLYGDDQDRMDNARVTVDDDLVVITVHDSDEPVKLEFSREQWGEIVNFVKWVWSEPTMAGRD